MPFFTLALPRFWWYWKELLERIRDVRASLKVFYRQILSFTGTRPHLADAVVAKNYLTAPELRALGQIVAGYLDFAERQAERQAPMTMRD